MYDDVPDLVCFDLPSLVATRPGTSEEALDRALQCLGIESGSALHLDLAAQRPSWPGRETRLLFGEVLGSDVWADAAAAAYDDAFGAAACRRGVVVVDGATDCIAQLRGVGAHIALTTEFSAATREAVLDVLHWPALVAMLVSDESSPGPEVSSVVTTALGRAGVAPAGAVVVSDSRSGIRAGRVAGVSTLVGIAGGRATDAELLDAGATCITTIRLLAGQIGAPLVPA